MELELASPSEGGRTLPAALGVAVAAATVAVAAATVAVAAATVVVAAATVVVAAVAMIEIGEVMKKTNWWEEKHGKPPQPQTPWNRGGHAAAAVGGDGGNAVQGVAQTAGAVQPGGRTRNEAAQPANTTGAANFVASGSGSVIHDWSEELMRGEAAPDSVKHGKIKSKASSSPKRETDPKKRIVITGMGLVSVFGTDIDVYYNKLLAGESGITPIDRFDASNYPVRIAGQIRSFSSDGYINGKDDRRLDDCWRYCLVAGKRALDDANLANQVVATMDKSRMGVLVGSAMGGTSVFSNGVETLFQKGHR
ncbi:3-oxoacyl-[acyl-carrier-protein] synthase II, chloroplastic-like [Salvia splendens]|uniref:3-oxoacyl-[acyl-carrier-protein] synthase II, chloroplastic-like n=1 Tax=Salvia splendens TaxID=180675 RepID=UPI001C2638FA|nr:3-oxoacyl-[acyl-carrier-protein] synthase II, chloroplastic-like [Salvia splendens]